MVRLRNMVKKATTSGADFEQEPFTPVTQEKANPQLVFYVSETFYKLRASIRHGADLDFVTNRRTRSSAK
jgi:hypothetical protein